jgi:hypothetical protein
MTKATGKAVVKYVYRIGSVDDVPDFRCLQCILLSRDYSVVVSDAGEAGLPQSRA